MMKAAPRLLTPSGDASGQRGRAPRARWGGQTWASLLVLLMLLGLPAAAQEPLPAPQGRVNDFARVLDPSTTAQLNALVSEVEQRTTAEIAVVVVHTTAPMAPKEYVTALFNQWGVGKRGIDNGVMVLLAVHDRRVEIETGYGVEGILPDGRLGEIIRTAMLPAFAHGRWGDGLVAGTQQVAQRLLEQADTLQPPGEPRPSTLVAGDLVYWIGWGYYVGWLGLVLVQRLRHRRLSSRVLALTTIPATGLLVWAFIPFIVPFLIGLCLVVVHVRRRCPTCGHWLSRDKRTVRSSTGETRREKVADCRACGYHDVQLVTPGLHGWFGGGGPESHGWYGGAGSTGVTSYGASSSGGGSDGGGSFGGGDSGGGGAGGSF